MIDLGHNVLFIESYNRAKHKADFYGCSYHCYTCNGSECNEEYKNPGGWSIKYNPHFKIFIVEFDPIYDWIDINTKDRVFQSRQVFIISLDHVVKNNINKRNQLNNMYMGYGHLALTKIIRYCDLLESRKLMEKRTITDVVNHIWSFIPFDDNYCHHF